MKTDHDDGMFQGNDLRGCAETLQRDDPAPRFADVPAPERMAVGHPVDVATGTVFTAWTDWKLLGNTPIRWRRFYSTASLQVTPLGRGWSTLWFMSLRRRGNNLVLVDDEGQEVVFPPAEGDKRLNIDAQMELVERDGQVAIYYWHHEQWYIFEPGGGPGCWRLAGIENTSGDRARARYDAANRLCEIIDPGGRQLRARYNAQGCIERMELVGASGKVRRLISYQYDNDKNLVRVVDALGRAILYKYDADGRLICETNRLGAAFHFTYDALGRCVRSWGDGGYLERKLEYRPGNRCTLVTDSRGAQTAYHLTEQGGVCRVVDALGGVSQRVKAAGIVQRVNAMGAVRQQEYDAVGDLVKVTDWDGGVTTYAYDEQHHCTERTNAEGNTWRFEYDKQGRPSGAVDAAGNAWRFECNQHGRFIAITNPRGGVNRFTYDRFGNRVSMTEPDGRSTHYDYDEMGNLTALTNRHGIKFIHDYDPCGRVLTVTSGGRVQLAFGYDAEDNLTRTVDAMGRETTMAYSPWGERVQKTLPALGVQGLRAASSWRYDTEGNVVASTDAEGREVQFDYDRLNRLVRTRFGDGHVEEHIRDAAGNIIEFRPGNSIRVKYEYDSANRLTAKHLPGDDKVEFAYDVMGRIVSAATAAATVEFVYDEMGNPIAETQGPLRIEREFDSMGNCVKLSAGEAYAVTVKYDEVQRPVEVNGPARGGHRFQYAPGLELPATHEFPNGLSARLEVEGPYEALKETLAPKEGLHGAMVRREYHLDPRGRVVRREEGGARTHYAFDEWGRLTQANSSDQRSETFQFDLSGNLVYDSVAGRKTYDRRNRFLEAGPCRHEYDDEKLVTRVREADREGEFRFDAEGRLTSVRTLSGEVVHYEYDAFNRRVAKVYKGRRTEFFWEGTNLLQEKDAETGRSEYFVWFPRTFRPLSKMVVKETNGDKQTTEYQYHLDLLGTPRQLTGLSGGVVWKADYSPFGEARVQGHESELNRFRFPGQYFDEETGLHYNQNRYYDPQRGRYISPDPIGFNGGPNLYAYAADPVNRADPLGLDCGDPNAVHLYHGTLDENALRESGFTTKDRRGLDAVPPFVCVSTDRAAAHEAINPQKRYDAQDAPAPAVLTGSMSQAAFAELHADGHLSTNGYRGFGGGLAPSSTETKAQTPTGVAALNRAFGLPGGRG